MQTTNKCVWISAAAHAFLLGVLVLGFEFAAPLPVFENTNQHDVISAVVLGDTAKSKILPQKIAAPPPPPSQTAAPKTPPAKPEIDKEAIALEKLKKQKLADQAKALLAKNLLADMKKESEKQNKLKQKQLQSQFQKTLHQQAENSLREQLLNEEIKLQGIRSRQSQGEVNKYKALILQTISEHWVVPPQANKNLYCQLLIRLAPGGLVLDVQVTKSSGDPALDSSARAAVLKSSPLPVPHNSDAFEAFRQFVLKVKPENILAEGMA